MAAFTKTKYQADNNEVHPIRLRAETAAVAGTAPSGAVTNSIRAVVRKGRNKSGLGARGVTAARTRGSGEDTFQEFVFIPCLTPGAFGSGNFVVGATISYKGQSYTVVGLRAEDIN